MPLLLLFFLFFVSCQTQATRLHHFSWSGKFAHIRATIPGDSLELVFRLKDVQKRIEATERDFSPQSDLSKRIIQTPKGSWVDLDSAAFSILVCIGVS